MKPPPSIILALVGGTLFGWGAHDINANLPKVSHNLRLSPIARFNAKTAGQRALKSGSDSLSDDTLTLAEIKAALRE